MSSVTDAFSEREAIRGVLVAYCHRLDTRRFASLEKGVFAPDAVFANERGGWSGAAEIARRIERAMQPFEGTAHLLSNEVIEVRGDEADSFAYLTAWHWLRETASAGPGRPADWVMVGAYRDRWVRLDAGWRIRHRDVELVGPGLSGLGRQPRLDL